MKELAIQKLKKDFSEGKYDRYGEIMKSGVMDALIEFCSQDEEFAQAVYQGESFETCMKAVSKNCGHGISDLEAYRRAVRFYFEGADIRFQMTVSLIPGETTEKKSEEPKAKPEKIFDLSSFL